MYVEYNSLSTDRRCFDDIFSFEYRKTHTWQTLIMGTVGMHSQSFGIGVLVGPNAIKIDIFDPINFPFINLSTLRL